MEAKMSFKEREIRLILDRFVLGGTYTIRDYECALGDIAEVLDGD